MTTTRTYKIKLKPNQQQKEQLNQYFYEAKVLYNYLLNCSNIFAVNSCKIKHPWKLDKDHNKVKVELTSLPAKLKQNVHRSMQDSIKSLSASKKNGRQVGHLKFKSEIKSIEFDNQSYQIVDVNHMKLAGFGRKTIRCRGLNQLDVDSVNKFCGSRLTKQDEDFYFCLVVKQEVTEHISTGEIVGLDFGIADTVTLSTSEKINCKIEETVRLKRLQRKYARSLRINGKRTNNSAKILKQVHKEYQKVQNQKKDFVNKLVHRLDTEFDIITFQDESLAGWKDLKGNTKTIQHSCLGLLKQKLVEKSQEYPDRYIMLSKWAPTTQFCPACGQKNPHGLEERTYRCSCGYKEDRDIHAAKNMLIFAGVA